MKLIATLVSSFLLALMPLARAAETQVFSTSAGPVKITPLYHASTLIEAGGKTIYLDPAKPAKFGGTSEGRPDSDYRHSWRSHGSGFD